jgi:hypothetical protein
MKYIIIITIFISVFGFSAAQAEVRWGLPNHQIQTKPYDPHRVIREINDRQRQREVRQRRLQLDRERVKYQRDRQELLRIQRNMLIRR